jgi:hypothetical protein
VIADHKNYAGYQARTTREIALVLLEPSSIRLMTRTYPDPPDSVETERTRRGETVTAFAVRFRELLAGHQ